ncbi:hypothetical protein L596_005637 [Steinernema carpocapsae]|nr:hypothetical protein L596_005637 [Steinernema carpocapsae]
MKQFTADHTEEREESSEAESSKKHRQVQRANRKLMEKPSPEDIEAENRRTVFVGNVPREVTTKEIQKMFSKAGAIDSVRLRGVYSSKEKMSKRTAVLSHNINENVKTAHFYVKYKEEESARKALELLKGTAIEECKLRIQLCTDDSRCSSKTSIFVGNLAFDTDEKAISDYFGQIGPVEYVRIVRDKDSGLGKGIAFVAFESHSSIIPALKLNGAPFNGRKIRVSRIDSNKKKNDANKKPKRKDAKGGEKKPKQQGPNTSRVLTTNRNDKQKKPALSKKVKRKIMKKKNAKKSSVMK